MNQPLENAKKTRAFWSNLESTEAHFQDSLVLLLCEEEEKTLHDLALHHLSSLREQRKKTHILILTHDPNIESPDKNSTVIVISAEQVENILCLYELYQFTDKLCFVSLTKPYGNKLKQLQQAKNCSLEDILLHCIFPQT